MTNLIAAIIITITTNWIDVGEFHQTHPIYAKMKVMEGFRTTNTVARVQLGGRTHDLQIESVRGPSIGRGLCNEYLGKFEEWPVLPCPKQYVIQPDIGVYITNPLILKEWIWCMTNGMLSTNSSTNYIIPCKPGQSTNTPHERPQPEQP